MRYKCFLLLFLSVQFVAAKLREKRLVLHSDTDIATEVLNIKAEMASLTATINTANKRISVLETTLTKVTNNDQGSTYTRWGRSGCSGNGTQLVYKGYMAGKDCAKDGSGANNLCLPEDPTWGKFDDGNQSGDRGYIYGTEYEETGNVIFGKHVFNQDVPCAVCKAPGVSVMIPARTNCYPGWNIEYTGYLMSGYQARSSPSDYVCVDADPEFLYRGESNTNGHTMHLVETICGTLPCPPYVSYRELACSVCSK